MALLSANLTFQIVEESLPWDRSTQMHIAAFLKRYTLHDSYWIGVQVGCAWGDVAVAVIRFDPVWNSSVSNPTSLVADWPLLFLRFNSVNAIRLSGFRDNGDTQRGISNATVESVSEEETITTISDHYGASVSLQHFPLVDALAMSATEEVIEIPTNDS
jgi:hypothetical protein